MVELPEHPGPYISDVIMPHLRAGGWSSGKVAEQLGIARQHWQEILAGRAPITPQVGARLGALLGPELAEACVCQMARREMAQHAQRLGNVLGAIPDLRSLALVPCGTGGARLAAA